MKKNNDNQETNKKKRLWTRILLFIVLAAVLMLAPYVYDAVRDDPNIILKKVSTAVTEDSAVDVQYRYRPGRAGILSRNRIPLYAFTPEESGTYTFSVTDVVSEDDVYLSLQVSDSHFEDYLSTDNMESNGGSFEDSVFLNGGSTCYILIEAFSEDAVDEYSGSFSFSVSKAVEDEGPAQVTESEPAVIEISEGSQTSALFVPEESGFFRFEPIVISGDRSASSDISSVKTTDNKEIKRSEGICYLEQGKEYYVWVEAQDMSEASVEVEVSCKRVESISADQTGEYRVQGDTIIAFTANETMDLAVYSVSDGNVRCSVYDSMGFPLNSDDDSGEDLSGNDKDFALVIQAQKKTMYLIYTEGQFNECSIVITEYKGDGSSIGKDDIAPGTDIAPDTDIESDTTEDQNNSETVE